MAFVFPEDKADFTAPNGVTYAWDGNKWRTKTYRLDDAALVELLKRNAVNDVTTAFRIKADGKTLISSSGNHLGLFNVKAPLEASHAATKGYVDTKLAEGGSGPTTKYDGNRYCKIGVSTTTLETGDVMFLNDQLVSEQTPSNIAAIALPIAEFDWDSCAVSGVIKVKNGAYEAGYYQVFKTKENAGRNMLVYVKPLWTDSSQSLQEGGAPCYFQGVFFG